MSQRPWRVLAVTAVAAVAGLLAACSGTGASGQPGASTAASGAVSPAAEQGAGDDQAQQPKVTVTVPPIGAGDTTGLADPSADSDATGATAVSSAPTAPTDPAAGSGDPTSATLLPASSSTSSSPLAPPPPPAAVASGSPAFGTTGMNPTTRVRISVAGGRITALTMTNPSGKVVTGSYSADHTSWTVNEDLGYAKKYTVTGTATNAAGKTTAISTSYTTVTPPDQTSASVSPGDGAVVGVAAPVIVDLGLNPTDKAAVEKHITITTSPKVTGSWAWIKHDGDTYPSLDFRPENYWPQYTKVHVVVDIYGLQLAPGVYGAADRTVDFSIGRNQVVTANAKTDIMTVTRSGKVVAQYPVSLGMGDRSDTPYGLDPDLVTKSGIHVVLAKYQKYLMTDRKYGYVNSPEYWAVRISDNGEFIHYNGETTAAQLGHINKTHGCINVGWDNAKAYYETAIYGDPVVVTGTSQQLSAKDGDIYDWTIPWSTWLTMSALNPHTIIT